MTPIQGRVLDAVRDLSTTHSSPSVRDIVRHINASGVSVVHAALLRLRDVGLVTWTEGEFRSIRVLADGPTRAAMERWSDAEVRRVALALHEIARERGLNRVVVKGRAAS